MRKITGATLAGVEIFEDLAPSERDGIAQLCRGREYGPGAPVISRRDREALVFFIISGTVRVTMDASKGREITFRDMAAGHLFCELSAIDGKPRSAHVIAREAACLAFISAQDFRDILERYPQVAKKTLVYLARLVRLLSDRVLEVSTLGVKNRIHAELLRLARNGHRKGTAFSITPAATHAEIASQVSTHREAVTRELGWLRRQGMLRREGKSLLIVDIRKLEQMVRDVREAR